MKILYHFRTRGTGAEAVHIAGIARAFEQLGHEVIFSSPTGIDPRLTAGSNPYREANHASLISKISRHCPTIVFELLEIAYNIPAFFRNARIFRRENCSAIYERHAFFLFSTALLARMRGVPLLVEVNELVGDERVRAQPTFCRFARWCDQRLFRAAHAIFVVSPHLGRRIAAQGIDGGKIHVLPNAVARKDYEKIADGTVVRARWKLGDAVVIGFVGWFVPWHRLDFLLDTIASLVREEANVKLLLVGEGPLRATLVERATELGIREHVCFTGAVPHEEINAHIAAMDICVVPHSNEYRSPIKLFEYMAAGRAILAPRTEPIAMVINHGQNGLLFEPGNSPDLEAKLRELVDDKGLRERIGKRARQTVLSQHTWEKNAEEILSVLER